ncbi:MAG: bifunctional 5,10-methylenetetrahydrofolate dehydrogenase/5,10-methenyltetrahydrofolate cyclohydrolase [Candidatus Omnitrophica bacterium]|nr:bifunctional 5,10-methylenetetrahydrofolate dehydrogenase/5,10-methenyltetrahydrofolate cyclohydrolase [Candidatus Omnitrophota bacterium]
MSANILDGRKLAAQLKDELREEVRQLQKQTGQVPRLVNILVGDKHDSCAYANSQKKLADKLGISCDLLRLPEKVSQADLIESIKKLNDDDEVHGIMIHRPIPNHIDYGEAANYLDANKDLEGINATNIGKMLLGETEMIPCTPASAMEHIKSTGINLAGKEAVIIGSSDIVGKPLGLLLLREMATVTVCNIATSKAGKLLDHIARAEILIVAVGKPLLVKGEWIKEGAIVIDVGINHTEKGMVGDVEFETAKEKASFITPVPGGVGPVTVVMLMRNGLQAFKHYLSSKKL